MRHLFESIIQFIRDYYKNSSPIKIFTLSNTYRGYKTFPIVVHGNETAEENNQRLAYSDIKGKRIIFKPQRSSVFYYAVYIENDIIGSIYDKDQIRSIQTNSFTDVYVKFIEENVVMKIGILSRQRARLFVKYKEK